MTKQSESTVIDEFPFLDPELVPFIMPLRTKIEEHLAWLEERNIQVKVGMEREWRGEIMDNWGLCRRLGKKPLHGQYLNWPDGFESDGSGDGKGCVFETRAIAENPLLACQNTYRINRDIAEVNEDPLFRIVANHYHWDFVCEGVPLISSPESMQYRPKSKAVLVGMMAMAEMAMPFSVPASYLHVQDGRTKGFGYSGYKSSSHRFKMNDEMPCVEERANLKGEQSLTELSVCRALGGARWGLENFQNEDMRKRVLFYNADFSRKPYVPFLPSEKLWSDHFRQKLCSARENPSVLQCFGEETTHGLLDYFSRGLDQYLSSLSLGTTAKMARSSNARLSPTPSAT